MTWIVLILLVYALIGAILVTRNMRSMRVTASLLEWVAFVLLWPLMIRFFLQLAVLQSKISKSESWTDLGDEKN